MNVVRTIRSRLGVTQAELAEALGVTQSNVSFYERGQAVPPPTAGKLIEFSRSRGLELSYDHVYGGAELPPPRDASTALTTAAALAADMPEARDA